MTRIKQTTVYKFDELSDEAKENAIEKLRDINVDFDDWYYDDGMLELSQKEMQSRHIKLSDKWYEKSPHANIKGEYPAYTGLFNKSVEYFDIDRDSYIQFKYIEVNDDDIFRKFLRIPKKLWTNCWWHFDYSPSRHSNTEFIIENNFDDREFTPKQQVIIDRAIDIMNDKISEALTMLRQNYEYQTSDEAIIETIKINEYEFDVDGNLD